MKTTLAILALVVAMGCKNESQQTTQSGDFKVEFLFEHDSCKVYRFKDGGEYVYWATCEGRTEYERSTQSGKTRVTHHEQCFTTKK